MFHIKFIYRRKGCKAVIRRSKFLTISRHSLSRGISVSRDTLRLPARHRFLPDPGLRSLGVNCHLVVGVVLDQRRRVTGPRLNRSVDSSHDDDDERRCAGDAAARFLHQSDRRLDDRLPRFRLRLADRIRHRQRHRKACRSAAASRRGSWRRCWHRTGQQPHRRIVVEVA